MDKLERLSKLSVIALAAIAIIAALDIAESIFAPVVLALVVGVVLSPVSDLWERAGFQPVTGALTSLAITLAGMGMVGLVLQPAIVRLVEKAPKVWWDIKSTVDGMGDIFERVNNAAEEVKGAMGEKAQAGASGASGGGAQEAMPSLTDALLLAPTILATILIFAGALFFFLLTRNEIYGWVARIFVTQTERGRLTQKLRQAERLVSRYFITITLINLGLGAAMFLVFQVIGLPDAILWGLIIFLMNFILYLGPAIVTCGLVFAGIAAFDGIWAAIPALMFVTVNMMEGQFVTPALVGKQLQLNPLLVFLALVFGIWLWGPIGGIVAIPMLLWILIVNNILRVDTLARTEETQSVAS